MAVLDYCGLTKAGKRGARVEEEEEGV